MVQPLGQLPPLDAWHVPVAHTHWPGLQQWATAPSFAQHVPGAQHTDVTVVLPHSLLGAGHGAALAVCIPNPPTTAAASAPPTKRKTFRRGIGVASILARSSKN
jgi:hypothetical protein